MDDKQKTLFHAAMSSNPPLFTDDPIVNHAIDCQMLSSLTLYDPELYLAEIEAWRNSDGWILSLSNQGLTDRN